MDNGLIGNRSNGRCSNWKKLAVMPDFRREKKNFFSEQHELWADD